MDQTDRITTAQCQKVFISRDYTEGTQVKFSSRFPPELEGKIEQQPLESTITRLNNYYADAEALNGSTYCENCLACLTAYISMLCVKTHYDKVLEEIAQYIEEQNRTIYLPRKLLLINPIERGLRTIEIVILSESPR